MAFFKQLGTYQSAKDLLNNATRNGVILTQTFLKSQAGRESSDFVR